MLILRILRMSGGNKHIFSSSSVLRKVRVYSLITFIEVTAFVSPNLKGSVLTKNVKILTYQN